MKKKTIVYGLFKTWTDCDTRTELFKLSYNKNELEKIRDKENKQLKKEIKEQINWWENEKKFNPEKIPYPKSAKTMFENSRLFIKKLTIN